MQFVIESEIGRETVEADDAWEAAGQFAARVAGFDSDEICWDDFSFTVDDRDFSAGVCQVTRPGFGRIRVSNDDEDRVFDQDGAAC